MEGPRIITAFGHSIAPRQATEETWSEATASNPAIPTTFAQLVGLIQQALGVDIPTSIPVDLPPGFDPEWATDTCGTLIAGLIEAGLDNPYLTDEEILLLEQFLEVSIPPLDKFVDFPNFYIQFTETGPEAVTESFVRTIGGHLQDAYGRYSTELKVEPTVVPCPPKPAECKWQGKILVRWYEIPAKPGYVVYGSTTIGGSIDLNSVALRGKEPLAWATASHELFHRVQFAVGLKQQDFSKWLWFLEGSTAWSELWTTRRYDDGDQKYRAYVTSPDRITTLFEDYPSRYSPLALLPQQSGYGCAALWVFAELYYSYDRPADNARVIRDFLANFRQHPDADTCYRAWWDMRKRAAFGSTLALNDAWRILGLTIAEKTETGALVRYQKVLPANQETPPPPEISPTLKPTKRADLRNINDGGSEQVVRGGYIYLLYDVAGLSELVCITAWADPPPGKPTPDVHIIFAALDTNNKVVYYGTKAPQRRIEYIERVESNWNQVLCILVTDLGDPGTTTKVSWEAETRWSGTKGQKRGSVVGSRD